MKNTGNAINSTPKPLFVAILLAAGAFAGAPAGRAQALSVIPAPASVTTAAGTLRIGNGASLSYPKGDTAAQFAAEHLAELVQQTRHIQLVPRAVLPGDAKALIVMTRTPATSGEPVQSESYDLKITPQQITISAAGDGGLYYGTVTLWQMLTATETMRGPAQLQCVQIHDEPQMRWRGIMLDSARHMQSVAFIRQLIDWMSLEKLNVLHWHLTDDQGWRLEIKRYPKLTQLGSHRVLASNTNTPTQAQLESHRYGGYYTQDEVRALVKYAAARNVTIVPEIEMPGHATAVLAAYPEFGSSDQHVTAPASEYGIFPSIYNVNDATFTFIENILTEVMQLFPSEYIHVGGDEALKDEWKASPTIQAQRKQLGISNEDALQSYFIKRIDTFLTAHHRRTLGWDEILQGGLAPNAAVMSWHGVQGGIDAAKQGHDAVLTPVRPLYLNYRQGTDADEAPGRFALNTLANVYAFDPAPATLTAEERKHILGVQGNLWSEYVITPERVEWMLFPRAAALAEIGWSAPATRDWNGFLERTTVEMRRYRALGIHFAPSAFRVERTATLEPAHDHATVELGNQTSFGTIRYTTDGSAVTAASAKYEKPLHLPLPTHLRAATFDEDEIAGSAIDQQLDQHTVLRRYSQEMKMCATDPVIAMEPDPPLHNGPVVLANYKNPCWIYKDADLKGIHSMAAGVVSLPYIFRDSNNKPPVLGTTLDPTGQVEVHLDTCSGKLLTTLPLPAATGFAGVTLLQTTLPEMEGTHDLCLSIARSNVNPLWALDWVQLNLEEKKSK